MTDLHWRIIFLLLGVAVGFVIGVWSINWQKSDGKIHVTLGDEEKNDRYLFEFNIPPEKIPRMKNVVFKVQLEQSSQKLQSP